MRAYVGTATGSRYLVTDDSLRRLNVGERSVPLRKDDQAMSVLVWVRRPTIGQSMVALLTGVSDDPDIGTLRMTSAVTWIRWEES